MMNIFFGRIDEDLEPDKTKHKDTKRHCALEYNILFSYYQQQTKLLGPPDQTKDVNLDSALKIVKTDISSDTSINSRMNIFGSQSNLKSSKNTS